MTVIFNKKNIKQASASHKNSYLRLIYFFLSVTTKSACGSIALIQQHVNSSISEEDQLKFDVDTVTYYRLIAKLAFILKSQIEARGLFLYSHTPRCYNSWLVCTTLNPATSPLKSPFMLEPDGPVEGKNTK